MALDWCSLLHVKRASRAPSIMWLYVDSLDAVEPVQCTLRTLQLAWLLTGGAVTAELVQLSFHS